MQILIEGQAEVQIEGMLPEIPRVGADRQTKGRRHAPAAKQLWVGDGGRVDRSGEVEVVALDVAPDLAGGADGR